MRVGFQIFRLVRQLSLLSREFQVTNPLLTIILTPTRKSLDYFQMKNCLNSLDYLIVNGVFVSKSPNGLQ